MGGLRLAHPLAVIGCVEQEGDTCRRSVTRAAGERGRAPKKCQPLPLSMSRMPSPCQRLVPSTPCSGRTAATRVAAGEPRRVGRERSAGLLLLRARSLTPEKSEASPEGTLVWFRSWGWPTHEDNCGGCLRKYYSAGALPFEAYLPVSPLFLLPTFHGLEKGTRWKCDGQASWASMGKHVGEAEASESPGWVGGQEVLGQVWYFTKRSTGDGGG